MFIYNSLVKRRDQAEGELMSEDVPDLHVTA